MRTGSDVGTEPGETWRAIVAARGRGPSSWTIPSGERLACWVVVNLEAFAPDTPIDGGPQAPDFPQLALREYGNRVGFWRLRRVLEEFDVCPSAAVNAAFFREWPRLAESVVQDGWDVMGHGDVNNRKLTSYGDAEEEAIAGVLADISAVTGRAVPGWLSPGLVESPRTLPILAKAGIEYVADIVADDVPFTLDVAPRPVVSVPYSLDNNDKAAYGRRNMTSDSFADSVIASFEQLYEEASPDDPRVMCLAVHPYLSGAPSRIAALRKVLARVTERRGARWCTGEQINRWFRSGEAASSPSP